VKLAAAVTLACVVAVWLGAELAFRLAAPAPLPPAPGQRCAVLVLGYPTRADGSPDPVQRIRVEAGVATLRAFGCERLVLSGGAAHNRFVEADAMAEIARALGVDAAHVSLERAARNTWENVARSLPLVADEEVLYVVSEALHARRGVRYVCRQQPDRCTRSLPVADAIPPDRFWWKPLAVVYEGWTWLRDRATPPGPPR
jgi:vancomycin permeability regulator SanA